MVISEPARPQPEPRVLDWLNAQADSDLTLSVLTVGEIARGIARMVDSRRKAALANWLANELPAQFPNRLLGVDSAVATKWGELTASAEDSGRPLHVVDGLLLATAAVHQLIIVTRNVRDF